MIKSALKAEQRTIRSILDRGKTTTTLGKVNNDNLSRSDQKRIKYPLYDIEFDTGAIISPIILSKKDWETKRKRTPFFEKIVKEGKIL